MFELQSEWRPASSARTWMFVGLVSRISSSGDGASGSSPCPPYLFRYFCVVPRKDIWFPGARCAAHVPRLNHRWPVTCSPPASRTSARSTVGACLPLKPRLESFFSTRAVNRAPVPRMVARPTVMGPVPCGGGGSGASSWRSSHLGLSLQCTGGSSYPGLPLTGRPAGPVILRLLAALLPGAARLRGAASVL